MRAFMGALLMVVIRFANHQAVDCRAPSTYVTREEVRRVYTTDYYTRVKVRDLAPGIKGDPIPYSSEWSNCWRERWIEEEWTDLPENGGKFIRRLP